MRNDGPPTPPTQCNLQHTSQMKDLSTNDLRVQLVRKELFLNEIHNKILTEFSEADGQ